MQFCGVHRRYDAHIQSLCIIDAEDCQCRRQHGKFAVHRNGGTAVSVARGPDKSSVLQRCLHIATQKHSISRQWVERTLSVIRALKASDGLTKAACTCIMDDPNDLPQAQSPFRFRFADVKLLFHCRSAKAG